jgi:hypothetical protein
VSPWLAMLYAPSVTALTVRDFSRRVTYSWRKPGSGLGLKWEYLRRDRSHCQARQPQADTPITTGSGSRLLHDPHELPGALGDHVRLSFTNRF